MSLENKEEKKLAVVDFAANIFGINFGFKVNDSRLRSILKEEISLYPNSDEVDVFIECCSKKAFKDKAKALISANKVAIEINSETAQLTFFFQDESLCHILFSLNDPVNLIHAWVQKLRNIEFSNRKDRIGQIIHEQVLVPAMLFHKDKFPIHCSAVRFNNQVILFGGHGGVGKTSLELELCYHNNGAFISDDIGMLSRDAEVYPNLSFPKIYGYNVEGKPMLQNQLINQNDYLDKLHWKLHFLKGANKVRRRVSPADIYNHYLKDPIYVNKYLILERFKGDKISTESLSAKEAAAISVRILKVEFSQVFSEIDKKADFEKLPYTSHFITKRWEDELSKVFKEIKCQKVLIPYTMEHDDFKESMLKLLGQQLDDI